MERGEVVRKIKLDPKYGGGEKEQRINIGSAISKLKISDEDKKKYLDWLARYKDNIRTSLGESKYGVIISRAPVDVIRMSDHNRITSCHSATGQYFQCAVQEAINGGAIAYVVKNDELNTFLDEGYTIQDEEIFEDTDRNSDGIVPVSRLRIRRLMSEDGEKEFAIPDKRIYGDSTIPGFYDTVKTFLHKKQPIDYDMFSGVKWEKRGGTYYDNNIDDLIVGYFSRENEYNPHTSITHNRGDSSSERGRNQEIHELTRDWETECQEIVDNINPRLLYSDVGFYIEWDEQPYILPNSEFVIPVRDWGFPELDNINFSVEDREDVVKTINGDYDDECMWSGLLSWLENQLGIKMYSFEFYNGYINFSIYYEDGALFSRDEFYEFADNIHYADIKIQNIIRTPNDFIPVFQELGILRSALMNIPEIEEYINNDEDPFGPSGILTMEGDLSELYVKVLESSFRVTPTFTVPPTFNPFNRKTVDKIGYLFHHSLLMMMDTSFKPKSPTQYQQQDMSLESYFHTDFNISFNMKNFFIKFDKNGDIINSEFWFDNINWDQTTMDYFLHINELSDHVSNLLRLSTLQILKEDHPTEYRMYFANSKKPQDKFYDRFLHANHYF